MTQTILYPSLVHLRPKSRCRTPMAENVRPLDSVDLDSGFSGATTSTDAGALDRLPVSKICRMPAASLVRKRVLVVDNELASTRLVRLMLEKAADTFEVCEVNDSRQALGTARRFQPQLVLLDIEMPGLDGSAVARQLREEPALRHVPILFMTSLVTPEEAEGSLFAAGSRVLAKPVTMSKLVQSVAEMLGKILAAGAAHPAPLPAV